MCLLPFSVLRLITLAMAVLGEAWLWLHSLGEEGRAEGGVAVEDLVSGLAHLSMGGREVRPGWGLG